MTYDSAGNTTTDNITGGGARTYDAENRMLTAVNGNHQYRYEADGKRTRRLVSGQTEMWLVYGINGELVAEYDASFPNGTLKKEYGYRGRQMLIVYDSTLTGDEQLKWMVTDHLGSTRMLADKTGSLSGITRHDYLPFGEELFVGMGTGSVRTTAMGYATGGTNDGVRKKFTGYERDDETGLDYAQARYYSSKQGRFISPDEFTGGPDELYDFADLASDNPLFYASLIQPQSLNKYQYCYNNPLSMIDPDGHGPETIWDAINVGIGVASFIKNVKDGNYKDAAIDAIGVVVDSAAVAVPIVPGGAGTAIKIYRGGRAVAKTIDRTDDAVDTLKAVDKAVDTAKAANKALEPRPKFRKKTVENALKDAPESADGSKICPTCGKKITGEKVGGKRDFDVDHTKKTWAQRKKVLADKPNLTHKEVIEEYQKDVRAQCPWHCPKLS